MLVTWIDSQGKSAWHDREEHERWLRDDNGRCVSTGFLFAETAGWILLVLSIGDEGRMAADAMKIPRFAIERITTVRTVPVARLLKEAPSTMSEPDESAPAG